MVQAAAMEGDTTSLLVNLKIRTWSILIDHFRAAFPPGISPKQNSGAPRPLYAGISSESRSSPLSSTLLSPSSKKV